MPLFPVIMEAHAISTVLQFVSCYPLIVFISALCCYTCYCSVMIAEVNLKPLPFILPKSSPRTFYRSCWFVVESTVEGFKIGAIL